MLQMVQLHSSASMRAGACTSKRTAPQWQPPRWVTSSVMTGCAHMSDDEIGMQEPTGSAHSGYHSRTQPGEAPWHPSSGTRSRPC
jgi:hypothetical protein